MVVAQLVEWLLPTPERMRFESSHQYHQFRPKIFILIYHGWFILIDFDYGDVVFFSGVRLSIVWGRVTAPTSVVGAINNLKILGGKVTLSLSFHSLVSTNLFLSFHL